MLSTGLYIRVLFILTGSSLVSSAMTEIHTNPQKTKTKKSFPMVLRNFQLPEDSLPPPPGYKSIKSINGKTENSMGTYDWLLQTTCKTIAIVGAVNVVHLYFFAMNVVHFYTFLLWMLSTGLYIRVLFILTGSIEISFKGTYGYIRWQKNKTITNKKWPTLVRTVDTRPTSNVIT